MKEKKEIVIVGSGGMARRYITNFSTLFPDVKVNLFPISQDSSIVSVPGVTKVISSAHEAIDLKPFSAIIASPAISHLSYAAEFIKNDIPVLIEKPLTDSISEIEKYKEILIEKKELIEIAYCLRYLPAAQRVKTIIEKETLGQINSVIVEVGEYLPDWRPEIDYKDSVSAQKSLGGGVLLELSHELDYLNWFFGPFKNVFCDVENTNTLDIDVEDRVDAILKNKSFVVNLHMDFLQRDPSRVCKIIGTKGSLLWNIKENSVSIRRPKGRKEKILDEPKFDKNKMYSDMILRFFEVSQKKAKPLVGLEDSIYVMSLIEAMRQSSEAGRPVNISKNLL